ncbi:DUF3418 domain-containing protein [Actinobaculum sp. 352]|uniref:DUF3418 domain-containing protein n=1 Tax=Actinobaculum sp. 352 TaxID=2490946 RepID=UPI001F49C1A9|nr:DUF3418 domain-containing protein [Actinobaculum sp. 352]
MTDQHPGRNATRGIRRDSPQDHAARPVDHADIPQDHADIPQHAAGQEETRAEKGGTSSHHGTHPRRSSRHSSHRKRVEQSRTRRASRPRPAFQPFSAEQLTARHAARPTISYPDLPVSARREEIAAAIRDNQVVVVAGETGSGKTTQLPKICLELGRGITGLIGHTQPRRIAARSVAERICEELDVPLGGPIGYQVRFTEEVSPTTLVKLMTDGILLAEIQSDPELRRYDTLIIDEAHERSLNIDFILGYLAQLLPRRPDLKVIITSATIDTERFAAHFGAHRYGGKPGDTAPVIEVSGRTYPVEIRYRPLTGQDGGPHEYEETHATDRLTPSQQATHGWSSTPSAPPGRARPFARSNTVIPSAVHAKPETPGRSDAVDQVTGIVEACDELMAEGPGDILVFLSGEGEIRDTHAALADELRERYVAPGGTSNVPQAVEVLPLFARLSAAEQHRIFAPHRHRRIVLATNIAETSLTVPGIRYVVDPGTARISRYSNKTKVQRLPIEAVSQASANQRAGRCGRVADGICIRLYSQEDFASRDEFTQPEIQRTSLASVILQMVSLGLGDISGFPFIDPPETRAVRAGTQLLEEIGALDTRGGLRLTRIGKQLARLPIDPRLGRMLLEAERNGCASEVLILVAALSVQDVRERPAEKRPQADQFHARFTARSSDFLAYLTLWRYLHTQQRELSGSAFRRMCRAEFLNYLRYREWADVVAQLQQMARPLGLTLHKLALPTRAQIRAARDTATGPAADGTPTSAAVATACRNLGRSADTPEAAAIHRSLLVGLLSNLGSYDQRTKDYAGARGTHFVIWPGSGLHRRTPEWVMAAELVETSRLFARTVAAIEPRWIEPLAKHLTKRSYSEPFWSARNGAAMCKEKVTLYGMTLVADRPVLLASLGTESAREQAREMFIHHGLVAGEWRTHHKFLQRNADALREAAEIEEKVRHRGIVADEDTLAAFYDERIPTKVVSGRHFDSWWKKARQDDPHLLDFTSELLVGDTDASDSDYPTAWVQGDLTFPISYSYNPGAFNDGMTVTIPVTLLPQVSPEGFDWLVPGMREELVRGTIRALPKRVRRQLVPAPDVAREVLGLLDTSLPYRQAFTSAVHRLRGVEISAADWQETELPSHLQVLFRVRSERGAVLDESTSLEYLQSSLAPQTHSAVESVVKGAVAQALDEAKRGLPAPAGKAEWDEVNDWPEEQIPASMESAGPGGMTVRGYPALVARGQKLSLDVLADPADQAYEHRRGVYHLLARKLELPEARITSRWNSTQSLALASSPYPTTSALVTDLQLASARNLLDQWCDENDVEPGELRQRAQWESLCSWARDRHEDEVHRLALTVAEICAQYEPVARWIKESRSPLLLATLADIRTQLSNLVPAGFVSATPQEQLPHLVRYLKAAYARIQKATTNPSRDDSLAWQIQDVTEKVESAQLDRRTREQLRWMLEEFRVSLFAQELGTQGKVSAKRIEKLLRA